MIRPDVNYFVYIPMEQFTANRIRPQVVGLFHPKPSYRTPVCKATTSKMVFLFPELRTSSAQTDVTYSY